MEGIVDTHPERAVEEPEITSVATMAPGPTEPTATADSSGGGNGNEAPCAWSLSQEEQVHNLEQNWERVLGCHGYELYPDNIITRKYAKVVSQLRVDPNIQEFHLEEGFWKFKLTALDLAILMGDPKIIQKILEMSSVKEKLKHEILWGKKSKLEDIFLSTTLNTGLTPLHLAVAGGDSYIVNMLLEKGADVNAQNFEARYFFDFDAESPLDLACKLGNVDMLRKLLEFDSEEKDPTHVAVRNRDVDFMKILPSLNVNALDMYRKTPLHHLATKRFLQRSVTTNIIKCLAEDKALDLKALDSQKLSAFYVAILCCNTELVIALLDSFKNEIRLNEACDDDCGPPIQIAFEGGEDFKDIQRALMECDPVRSYMELLYRDRQVYVDAANAILVGAALIASVTFASWLQPPLNYTSYFGEGDSSSILAPSTSTLNYVDVENNRPLRAFWVFNALSFYFAIATVVCGARSVLPRSHLFIKKIVDKLRSNLLVTSILLACSVLFVIIAFAIAGTIVVTPMLKYQWYMIGPTLIGGIVCIFSLGFLFKSIKDIYSGAQANREGLNKGIAYLKRRGYFFNRLY